MKVYITMDMEGISGICNGDMARTGSAEWANRGRYLATADVNAAIEGALAAGATQIWVNDAHDSGDNILREKLNPAAELISGWVNVAHYMPGLDSSYDAVFLLGFHARMGTRNAHFDHSVSTASINEIRINGQPMGEIGLYALYAGVLGVPVLLVTGDAAAAAEASDLLGEIQTVSVKQGIGRFAARILSPEVTQPMIRDAAERALHAGGKALRLEQPLQFSVDFLRSAEADMAEMVPGSIRTGARTVTYSHEDAITAFRGLNAMINLGGIAASRWASGLYTRGNRVA